MTREEIKNDIVNDVLNAITEDSLEKFIQEQSHFKSKAEKQEQDNIKLLDELEAKKLLDLVIEEIKKYGGDTKRIITENKGSNFPLGTNETEEGKSINRRVEVKIIL